MTENLAHPQFSKGLSGYKVEEVDSYIDKVLDTIKDLKDQNEVLEEKIGVLAESLQKYREDEDSLREALLGAQKMGDSIVKNANNKAEITMREASVKAAHIVEEARKKVEDEKDELIRVQTAAADFKAKLIELYREHIELVTRIPVSDSAPAEEAPAVEEPIAEEVAETVEVAEPAVEPTPVEAAEEAAAEHEEQSAPVVNGSQTFEGIDMFKIISVVIGFLLLGLDQWSKQWAITHLEGAGTVPALPGLFNFDFLPNGNDGAAWGMLSGKQTLLIAATAVMLLAIIIYMVAKRKKMANMAFLSLILVVSGGVGNLIDRVAQGYVVDFIRFAFWNRFPTFNVADIAITVGVALLVIYILFIDGKKEKQRGTP